MDGFEPIFIPLIIEGDYNSGFVGSAQSEYFLFTTIGSTIPEVTENIRCLIGDFLLYEGREIPVWKDVNIDNVEISHEYDIASLFEVFDGIKVGAIADIAGINRSLMRQYTSGVKIPSITQARKIEDAIHKLGTLLMEIQIAQ